MPLALLQAPGTGCPPPLHWPVTRPWSPSRDKWANQRTEPLLSKPKTSAKEGMTGVLHLRTKSARGLELSSGFTSWCQLTRCQISGWGGHRGACLPKNWLITHGKLHTPCEGNYQHGPKQSRSCDRLSLHPFNVLCYLGLPPAASPPLLRPPARFWRPVWPHLSLREAAGQTDRKTLKVKSFIQAS